MSLLFSVPTRLSSVSNPRLFNCPPCPRASLYASFFLLIVALICPPGPAFSSEFPASFVDLSNLDTQPQFYAAIDRRTDHTFVYDSGLSIADPSRIRIYIHPKPSGQTTSVLPIQTQPAIYPGASCTCRPSGRKQSCTETKSQ